MILLPDSEVRKLWHTWVKWPFQVVWHVKKKDHNRTGLLTPGVHWH